MTITAQPQHRVLSEVKINHCLPSGYTLTFPNDVVAYVVTNLFEADGVAALDPDPDHSLATHGEVNIVFLRFVSLDRGMPTTADVEGAVKTAMFSTSPAMGIAFDPTFRMLSKRVTY